jgi:hypothetical protein
VLSPRSQVAVAAGFAVLVLATIGPAVYLLTGLGSGGDDEAAVSAASEAAPVVRDDGARAACSAFADALKRVVPLLTPVAPAENDAARGEAVQFFLRATEGLDPEGSLSRFRLLLAARMGLLAFTPDDAAEYAQRYADYRATLAELADACRRQEVPIPQLLPA